MGRVFSWSWYNMLMIGMTLEFVKKVDSGETDDFNNVIFTEETLTIADCLIAPAQEPLDRVESAALDRNQTIVRIHLPKADTRDVSNSTVEYDGQTFRIMGRAVKFMDANTPTRWNRYMRAEAVNG